MGEPKVLMMMILVSFTLTLAAFYVLIGLLNHLGLSKKYPTTTAKPFLSVLVAARNEEANIAECLTSLEELQYPRELLQVCIINDRSTDQTNQIASTFCDRLNHFILIDVDNEINGLQGKMNALSQGLDQAKGDIILITDADCRVPLTWAEEMSTYFTEGTAMVGGLTIIGDERNNSRFFNRLQQLDWLFLQSIASGTAGIGVPVSILGNNFGFKKSVYDEIGGFRSIGFSLTEDMALLRTISRATKYQIAYRLDRENTVRSLPLENFKEFYEQRKRWLRGGLRVNFWGWTMMLTSFVAHFMIVGGIFIFPLSSLLYLAILAVLLTDISLIWRTTRRIKLKGVLSFFPLYEAFYIFYSILLAINLFYRSPINWKQRTYNNKL
jgi:cellulose synthase/poly-beta-1,6-N-acetylglucosamine synthase-like glycosyltransferase